MSINATIVSTHLGHVRGGGEVNDLRLGSSLSELGHDVGYITLNAPNKEFLPPDHQHRTVECPYWYDRSYDLPSPLGKGVRHLNEELFVHRIKKEYSDVLAEQDLVLTTGRPILSRLVSSTDGYLLYSARGRVNPLYDRYLTRTDGLIFWGGCEREYENQAVLSHPHVTLDPAVDTDIFRPLAPPERVELQTGKRITIGFVGRLEPVKQVDRIIDAVASLVDTYFLHLLIVGDGSRRAELDSRAEQRLPSEAVDFIGRVDREEVPRYLNSIDIFVMSSRLENHPIALKEAVACGTFCVAPNIGRVGEILDDDVGIAYSLNDSSALTETLESVLESEKFREGTREERSQPFNSWMENAKEIVEFYRSINTDGNNPVR